MWNSFWGWNSLKITSLWDIIMIINSQGELKDKMIHLHHLRSKIICQHEKKRRRNLVVAGVVNFVGLIVSLWWYSSFVWLFSLSSSTSWSSVSWTTNWFCLWTQHLMGFLRLVEIRYRETSEFKYQFHLNLLSILLFLSSHFSFLRFEKVIKEDLPETFLGTCLHPHLPCLRLTVVNLIQGTTGTSVYF